MDDYYWSGVGNPNHPANRCSCTTNVEEVKDLIEELDSLFPYVEINNGEFYELFQKLLRWKENN